MSTTVMPVESPAGFTIVTHVIPPQTTPAVNNPGPIRSFLKGEPKAIGTVQIMTGIVTLVFGIVIAVSGPTLYIYSGVFIWGSVIYISAGSLSVAAENSLNSCVVKGCLTMNVISAVTAGIAIILLSIDIVLIYEVFHYLRYNSEYRRHSSADNIFEKAVDFMAGIRAVLLVMTVFQMVISICISAFSCKATCCGKPMTVYSTAGSLPLRGNDRLYEL
ncbi:membrane-spanning 4-domains subfamily A member 4A-like [Brachyhypopomus gauderio]|uniref:membrane-spanning 4-domains subfamily A member 4A-like n=1 Tax=Brachyhypopomus gauderio TaxID=698409 RepID=UPI004041319C